MLRHGWRRDYQSRELSVAQPCLAGLMAPPPFSECPGLCKQAPSFQAGHFDPKKNTAATPAAVFRTHATFQSPWQILRSSARLVRVAFALLHPLAPFFHPAAHFVGLGPLLGRHDRLAFLHVLLTNLLRLRLEAVLRVARLGPERVEFGPLLLIDGFDLGLLVLVEPEGLGHAVAIFPHALAAFTARRRRRRNVLGPQGGQRSEGSGDKNKKQTGTSIFHEMSWIEG